MKLVVPPYVEGVLQAQYKGGYEGRHKFWNKGYNYGKAWKYSIRLYKDVKIADAIVVTEERYLQVKGDPDNWWKIDHTAESAIYFTAPFFNDFSFLRFLPLEVYVERPSIDRIIKKDAHSQTYGSISGRVLIKLVEDRKEIMTEQPEAKEALNGPTLQPKTPLQPKSKGCFDQGCFGKNAFIGQNGCFRLNDGSNQTGGCFGLSGGPVGPAGCFGNYGNPQGCFSTPTGAGCFPNLGMGFLLPLLFLLLLLFSLFRSCGHLNSVKPLVETIKKDRDDSRIPPPVWDGDPVADSAMLPDYVPVKPVIRDTLRPITDSTAFIPDSSQLAQVKKGYLLLYLWDWDREDGDSVNVYLNEKLIGAHIRLLKKPQTLMVKALKYGENYLRIDAINVQKGSNTVACAGFSDRNFLCNEILNLQSNEIRRLTLVYK